MRFDEFFDIVEEAQKIIDSSLDWKTKFDLIFSKQISGAVSELGVIIDWYDPDMDYQDDVMAYFMALKEKAEELRLLR